MEDAVDVAPLLGDRVTNQRAVLGHRHVELEHVDAVAELAGGALGERQRPPGAGQHDLGALVQRDLRHAERQRRIGHHTGDHDLLALEQSHARQPSPARLGRRRALERIEMRSMCHAVGMRIGILGGTGPAGSGLAARLASIGHDVVIGSRSKYRSMETVDELVSTWPELAERLTHGDNAAAADCELIVMATPWDSAAGTAQENEEALAGKVVVSMANALVRVNKEFQPLVPPRGSVAAHVQAAVPRCRVVAAFHHLPATELGHINEPIDSDVLICGDDPAAVQTVSAIVAGIPGCRPLDAGELSNATAIEAFTAVLLQLNVRYKTRVAPKLTGIKRDPRAVEPTAERRDPMQRRDAAVRHGPSGRSFRSSRTSTC